MLTATGSQLLDPLDFIARLVALIPPPHFNTIRYHGVLAARATARSEVVPGPAPDQRSPVQLRLVFDADATPGSLETTPAPTTRHPWAAFADLPRDRRPVEISYRVGDFIARVRATKVLVREPHPEWWQDSEYCTRTPNLRWLAGDRESGLALVGYDYVSGGCLCDDWDYVAPLRLSPELFEEIDRRPTTVLELDEAG